jgi:hypothetical protein
LEMPEFCMSISPSHQSIELAVRSRRPIELELIVIT